MRVKSDIMRFTPSPSLVRYVKKEFNKFIKYLWVCKHEYKIVMVSVICKLILGYYVSCGGMCWFRLRSSGFDNKRINGQNMGKYKDSRSQMTMAYHLGKICHRHSKFVMEPMQHNTVLLWALWTINTSLTEQTKRYSTRILLFE